MRSRKLEEKPGKDAASFTPAATVSLVSSSATSLQATFATGYPLSFLKSRNIMSKTRFTHLRGNGEAHMVDVSDKDITKREAVARTFIEMQADTITQILDGQLQKGDVFAVARVAGIQAAKKCADLIPLCHPLMLTKIEVDIAVEQAHNRIRIESTCQLLGKTGVEMEALTSVSVAALCIYDMCKAVDKQMKITSTQLINKTGGRSTNSQQTNNTTN